MPDQDQAEFKQRIYATAPAKVQTKLKNQNDWSSWFGMYDCTRAMPRVVGGSGPVL